MYIQFAINPQNVLYGLGACKLCGPETKCHHYNSYQNSSLFHAAFANIKC